MPKMSLAPSKVGHVKERISMGASLDRPVREERVSTRMLRWALAVSVMVAMALFTAALFTDPDNRALFKITIVGCFGTYLAAIVYSSVTLARRLGARREAELRQQASDAEIKYRIKLARQCVRAGDEIVRAKAEAFAHGYIAGREGSWLVDLDRQLGGIQADGESEGR